MPEASTIPLNCTLLRRRVLRWYRSEGRSFPWRFREDPWEVLLAELLLQRTRADLVAPVYLHLLTAWPTATNLADADPATVESVLKPLGFLHRNRRIQAAAAACRDGVPSNAEKLLAVPGVGQYAATATLCFAFGRRLAVLDPTIIRVMGRLDIARSDHARPRTDASLWLKAQDLLPRDARMWNYALLDFGAVVCRRTPRCRECPLLSMCPAGQTSIGVAPGTPK